MGYRTRKNTHPLYGVWAGIKTRCFNKNVPEYKYYGGRGINICDEWLHDPTAFIEWAISNGWKRGLHIDRINNNDWYRPDNCRFVSPSVNNSNRKKLSSSGRFIGVRHDNRTNNYYARITVNGKDIGLGGYSNPIDAAVVRDSYIISNGLGRLLNFPQQLEAGE